MASPVSSSSTYPADTTSYEWLVNDWDANSNLWVNVQGDYTVALQDQGFYGVQLRHVAEQLDGNLKSIAVVPTAGGVELEQVDELIPPGAGQYRMSPLPTGRIEFSSASNGVQYTIKYISSGTVNRTAGRTTTGAIVYYKELTVSVLSGATLGSVAHGIASAMTDNLILDARVRRNNTTNIGLSEKGGTYDAEEVFWDDTTIYFNRTLSAQTTTYYVTIVYKEA